MSGFEMILPYLRPIEHLIGDQPGSLGNHGERRRAGFRGKGRPD